MLHCCSNKIYVLTDRWTDDRHGQRARDADTDRFTQRQADRRAGRQQTETGYATGAGDSRVRYKDATPRLCQNISRLTIQDNVSPRSLQSDLNLPSKKLPSCIPNSILFSCFE